MNFEIPNFAPAVPEIFVLIMACAMLLVEVYRDQSKDCTIIYILSLVTLAIAAALTLALDNGKTQITFDGMFVSDSMSSSLKLFTYLITGAVLVYSRKYLMERDIFKGEYFVLALFSVLGMMVMISAHNTLAIYMGLELMSLCLYAMVAMRRDSREAIEAAMKYFVLGALGSGMLLYGLSILYGATGTLDISEMATIISAGLSEQDQLVLMLGVTFSIVGLAFKLGAVPFHMWVPDVYHGAPTAVTLFISSAPKLAAFALVMRLLVEGTGDLIEHWQSMLVFLAILSIAIGNLVAIAQTNMKRMLAYSAIAHIGFLLFGIIAGSGNGYASSMFYIIAYALMSMGGFGMIILLSKKGFEADTLEDFKGLNDRSPWYAFIMLILMFSMAGVPISLGFWAKLAVLQALVESGFVWLAVAAVIFSVIGAFYYLRIVWYMYFEKPADDVTPISSGIDVRIAASINGLAILLLGIFPASLTTMCDVALGLY
ncbi:MAG: NADH-quinone oxidoreductase subunit NuoN [Gammaproteobacteria bacterium]|nr:NADH-quinone oxidoreductase subunit NuoN [Gammaproteobacteria bacterium]